MTNRLSCGRAGTSSTRRRACQIPPSLRVTLAAHSSHVTAPYTPQHRDAASTAATSITPIANPLHPAERTPAFSEMTGWRVH